MSEPAYISTLRCVDLPQPDVESKVRHCGKCQQPVWVSLSTLKLEDQYDVEYVCQVCMPPEQFMSESQVAVSTSQRRELEEKIGVWATTLLLVDMDAQEIEG